MKKKRVEKEKKMKKRFAGLFVCICLLLSALFLTGCGITEKAAETAGEKMAENALGGKVEVDGDEVTVKGDNGEEAVIGGKWPDSELAGKIPEFTKGNVISSFKEENNLTITLENVKAEEFDAYLEEIKKAYSEDSSESEVDGVSVYEGFGADRISVSLYFVREDETLIITVTKNT
jgi:hypothetical protein